MTLYSSIGHVFFPDSGVVSVVAVYADGSIIEMATIGRGLYGYQAVFGAKISSVGFSSRSRERSKECRARRSHGPWGRCRRSKFHVRLTSSLSREVWVSVACNGAHSLKERLARWLLMMRDRGGR